ncbi:MAG: lipopolysaccharide kinase InaA family protein [Gemmataceae bacterium]
MFSHFLRKLTAFRTAPELRTVRIGERKWRLAPNAMFAFGPNGPDLDRWIANGSASIVKSGPHRTVYRVQLPGGVVFVKHCRILGARAWLREAVRPAKARLEFENLFELQKRGIPAAVPLAWGTFDSPWPGESWLITKSLDDAVPFTALVAQPMTPGERRELARSLGRFFAKLHDAGVDHPDPHPGNLLVRDGRFSLIDLHAVGLTGPLSWKRRRANLVLFNRWFQLRANRTDRLRFWRAYTSEHEARARDVEQHTAASNRRFWAGRVSRCLGNNRYFHKLKRGPYRGFTVRDLSDEILEPFLNDPDSLFHSAKLLKDSRTSKVAIVSLGGRELLLKRVNIRGRIEPLKNALRPSAVLRSWINGHSLRDRWLPTPRPLAMLHRMRNGLPAEGWLLTELVQEPAALAPSEAEKLARTLRQMHDRGVSHRDLKASNILLERGTDPVFIDLVGVRLGSPPPFRQRSKELARINASFLGATTHTTRLRFLLTYLNAGECRLANWKDWWRAIRAATEAKQAKNRRSGRPLA